MSSPYGADLGSLTIWTAQAGRSAAVSFLSQPLERAELMKVKGGQRRELHKLRTAGTNALATVIWGFVRKLHNESITEHLGTAAVVMPR